MAEHRALGLDLGGTKIAAQVFDADWQVVAQQRIATPADYAGLCAALAELTLWGDGIAGRPLPVGIGAAGRVNPATGHVVAANICANDRPLPRDLSAAIGRRVTYLNDAHALALSEAHLGAGQGSSCVAAVVIGTGVGGGIVLDGTLRHGPGGLSGEFGHTAAPCHLVGQHGLPVVACGCGALGCYETLIAGRGLQRLAQTLTAQDLSPPDIAAQRQGDMAQVWDIWCALTADMLRGLVMTVDPDVIVLAGGLSRIDGVAKDLTRAVTAAQIGTFPAPPIRIAQGGDDSGARGAAFAAAAAQ